MERNQRSERERNDFNETHPDDEFGVKITRMHTRKGPATLEHKHGKSIPSLEDSAKSVLNLNIIWNIEVRKMDLSLKPTPDRL